MVEAQSTNKLYCISVQDVKVTAITTVPKHLFTTINLAAQPLFIRTTSTPAVETNTAGTKASHST